MRKAHVNQTQKTSYTFFVFPDIVGKQKGKTIPTGEVSLNQITSYMKRCVYILGFFIPGAVVGQIQLPAMLQLPPWIWLETGRERSLQMDVVSGQSQDRQWDGYHWSNCEEKMARKGPEGKFRTAI